MSKPSIAKVERPMTIEEILVAYKTEIIPLEKAVEYVERVLPKPNVGRWREEFREKFTYEYTEQGSDRYVRDWKSADSDKTINQLENFIQSLLTAQMEEVEGLQVSLGNNPPSYIAGYNTALHHVLAILQSKRK